MKLKKIASLLLAGVMAVSMLAGCSSSSSSSVTTDTEEESVTVTYAATLYSYLTSAAKKRVSTSDDNSTLTSALETAIQAYVTDDYISNLGASAKNVFGSGTAESDDSHARSLILELAGADYYIGTSGVTSYSSFEGFAYSVGAGYTIGNTALVVYAVDGVFDTDAALALVAGVLNSDLSAKDAAYDYTMTVSVVTASTSSGSTGVFVAVMIECEC